MGQSDMYTLYNYMYVNKKNKSLVYIACLALGRLANCNNNSHHMYLACYMLVYYLDTY